MLAYRSNVTWLEFAADGTLYAGDDKGSLYAWVPVLGKPSAFAVARAAGGRPPALSADGRWLAYAVPDCILIQPTGPAASTDGVRKTWHPKPPRNAPVGVRPDWPAPTPLADAPSGDEFLTFLPGEPRLAVVRRQGRRAVVWDARTGARVRTGDLDGEPYNLAGAARDARRPAPGSSGAARPLGQRGAVVVGRRVAVG